MLSAKKSGQFAVVVGALFLLAFFMLKNSKQPTFAFLGLDINVNNLANLLVFVTVAYILVGGIVWLLKKY